MAMDLRRYAASTGKLCYIPRMAQRVLVLLFLACLGGLPHVQAADPDAPVHKLTGSGQQVERVALREGLAVFHVQCETDGHFAVSLLDSNGDSIDLLVNHIGAFYGSKAVAIEQAGTYMLQVKADSQDAWLIDVTEPRSIRAPRVEELFGTGQTATRRFWLDPGPVIFELHQEAQDGLFAATLLDAQGHQIELLALQIGGFVGDKVVKIETGGPYLINVSSEGDWTIKIQP
jgi:hypothetical protein